MLKLTHVEKKYQMGENTVHALRGISLEIEPGDFVAILGPSGSGKSTLMHVLGLLDAPSSGSYSIDDQEVGNLSEDELAVLRRERFGFIFQQFNLLPRITAAENVALPLLYSQGKFDAQEAMPLLKSVHLEDRFHHRTNELSGGQQQRVAIARALINRPRVIFADEPTGNLDSKSEKEILELLERLNREGITLIMVTHEEEIGAQAKRRIRMRDGVIQSDERLKPISPQGDQPHGRGRDASPRSALTQWKEHFRQGLRTLWSNRIRTALSMLGILIGVAAVVAMLAIGRGAQKAIETQLSSLGSNLLSVRPGSLRLAGVAQESGTAIRLYLEDAQLLRERLDHAREVAPMIFGKAQVTYRDQNTNTSIYGSTAAYARMRASEPEFGRFFVESENRTRARVAVVGATVVKQLFGNQNPIGETIKINRVNFQVIGILPEKGASGFRDQDDTIMIPVQTAMYRLYGRNTVDSIDVEVTAPEWIESTKKDIVTTLSSRQRVPLSQQEDAFQVRNMADIQAALSETARTMSLLLACIAAIALLVGGIGIMNIMLVSVTERTREIGLRKAVGARKRDILSQFLVESVVVSASGGAIGVALGWGITLGLSAFAGWATSVSLANVILALGFSAGVGILFGIYPARKASELDPIIALRHE